MNSRMVTSGGHDRDPVLSPDGRRIVFLRANARPAKDCAPDGSDGKPVELWSVNSDGSGALKLLATHGGENVDGVICDFANMQFNSTGSLLYFETPAWATSGAIHVYDFKTGKERLFLPGNGLQVLSRCRDARYRDDVIATQHRYFVFSGSYDWAFLFTPSGKEVGPLGEGDFSSDLADSCG
jgi:WD40-like Beta Propeller Repeat